MTTEQQKIVNRLRSLASEMIDLGFDMNHYGGFSEMAVHGAELINAGSLANSWAAEIGIEEEGI